MSAPAVATASTAPPPADGLVLRDIHLPAAPSWWPPAPGWWLLAGLLLLMLVAVVLVWRRRRAQQQRQARILLEIDHLAQIDDDAALAAALHQWLRRAARTYAAGAAQQRGDAWRQTLAQVPVDAATLDQLLRLEQRIYQPSAAFDRIAALAAARRWMALALALRQPAGQRSRSGPVVESADA